MRLDGEKDVHLDSSSVGSVSRLEVLEGPSGRRVRSEAERARIVAESLLPGAQVSEVAQARGDASADLRLATTLSPARRIAAVRGFAAAVRAASRGGAVRGASRSGCHTMIAPGADLKIYIATRPIDFRCGHDGLAAKVQQMLRLDPFSGAAFVFRCVCIETSEPDQDFGLG